MSAGSGGSNLGYSKIAPLSNINGGYVNVDNSNSPTTFGSNQIPGLPGLAGAKSNIDAAAGYVPGICFKGGAKKLKRKIKNITKQYKKMKAGSRKMKSLKMKLKNQFGTRETSSKFAGGRRTSSKFAGGRRTSSKFAGSRRASSNFAGGRKSRRSRYNVGQRGGHSQYQNNLPLTPVYQVAGINLPNNQLGLANPPPVTALNNCVNCVDNYNHFTNTGFPSRGH
jgi:hypothetical protein